MKAITPHLNQLHQSFTRETDNATKPFSNCTQAPPQPPPLSLNSQRLLERYTKATTSTRQATPPCLPVTTIQSHAPPLPTLQHYIDYYQTKDQKRNQMRHNHQQHHQQPAVTAHQAEDQGWTKVINRKRSRRSNQVPQPAKRGPLTTYFAQMAASRSCFRCGQKGHLRAWCKQVVQCAACRRHGHLARRCRTSGKSPVPNPLGSDSARVSKSPWHSSHTPNAPILRSSPGSLPPLAKAASLPTSSPIFPFPITSETQCSLCDQQYHAEFPPLSPSSITTVPLPTCVSPSSHSLLPNFPTTSLVLATHMPSFNHSGSFSTWQDELLGLGQDLDSTDHLSSHGSDSLHPSILEPEPYWQTRPAFTTVFTRPFDHLPHYTRYLAAAALVSVNHGPLTHVPSLLTSRMVQLYGGDYSSFAVVPSDIAHFILLCPTVQIRDHVVHSSPLCFADFELSISPWSTSHNTTISPTSYRAPHYPQRGTP